MAKADPSFETTTGVGGETHQQVPVNGPHGTHGGAAQAHLTTNQGIRISDNQNSLKAGERGPTLLEDFVLREKIFHFDHERIPERIVHARGSAAHGVFECTKAIPELTAAGLFSAVGKQTLVFTRFSTVAGGAGSVDTPRDVRGFAVKFYTDEGNWDLVGNNIPVFFIQDAIKFPDLVHAVKMEADKGYPQAASAHDTFWDFVSLMPESIHMVMWQMSDRTIPRSLRFMEGFGIHTFRLVNAEGASKLVKFHWKPVQGLQSTTWDEAVKIAGADPDYHRRDLYEAIESGDFPAWDLGVQVFEEGWALEQPFDVLDATKLIPEELVPVTIIGRMTLNRNPDNFFAETEQSAFCPANIVPGIDFTPDPLLQGRLFSYLDTQKSRLGTANFHQLPINAPKCPMHNFQRDGMMQMEIPKGRANYEPNSLNEAGEPSGPRECPATGFTSFARGMMPNSGDQHLRVRPALFADHYSQARLFYQSQTPVEQAHLASALVFELSKVGLEHVRHRMLTLLGAVNEDLARRVAGGLAMDLPAPAEMAAPLVEMAESPSLSILEHGQPPMAGRKVAILFAQGSNLQSIEKMKAAIEGNGGKAVLIAQKVGGIPVNGGLLKADGQLAGSPSALFDAVASIINPDALDSLRADHAVHAWFADAYAHCKTIGACPATNRLLEEWGIARDEGITSLDDFPDVAPARHWAREAKVRLLA
ncbi:catalase [Novosphingobium sp. KACC 22771]|uniref:catalase n=1 Tax=Novosphingobium sp. KACC 22771 TaxID=3025670 RepID=UPI002365686B|nr:catalase [Novosphingobium sp. KACC 22771]WDF74033.1 catalase [Novosphingobium sp. KACC 22771]